MSRFLHRLLWICLVWISAQAFITPAQASDDVGMRQEAREISSEEMMALLPSHIADALLLQDFGEVMSQGSGSCEQSLKKDDSVNCQLEIPGLPGIGEVLVKLSRHQCSWLVQELLLESSKTLYKENSPRLCLSNAQGPLQVLNVAGGNQSMASMDPLPATTGRGADSLMLSYSPRQRSAWRSRTPQPPIPPPR